MNPILALIIANLIWGAASPIFKFALSNIPPFILAFIRFFIPTLIFIPFIIKYRQKMSLATWTELIISAFFGITVNIGFFFLGLQKAPSINAPIIASAGPVFIYFLSIICLREKARFKVLFGMIISLIGVLVIILSPIFLDGKTWVIGQIEGNLFFVLAMSGAVINTILNKNLVKKINVFQLTGLQFLFGALMFAPFMFEEFNNWSFAQLNFQGWTGIIYGVIFSSTIAYFLFNFAMEKIKAQEVGIFTYIDPLAAVLIAIPLIQEYPNIYFFIGSILVFGGIFLAENRIHWHPLHKLKDKFNI